MTVKKQNAIYFLVIFLFIIGLNEIFATTCLTMSGTTYGLIQLYEGQSSTEYVVKINADPINVDTNLVFTKTNANRPDCLGKTFVLVVDKNITFELKDQNQYISISGDLNIIRFESTQQGGAYINFFVNNSEQLLHHYASMGILDIKVPLIEVKTTAGIRGYEKDREFMDGASENSPERAGFGVSIKLKEIEIKPGVDFNISLIANNRRDNVGCTSGDVVHADHGGDSELKLDTLTNYGNLLIFISGGNGSNGVNGCYRDSIDGGLGGNGGKVLLDINQINNYNKIDLNLNSGIGGNGGQGSDEGVRSCRGHPENGGSAGNGGDINLFILNIENKNINSIIELNGISGSGGYGGRAGKDRCQHSDKKTGGSGGHGGKINSNSVVTVINYGDFIFNLSGGAGGAGGNGSRYRSTARGETGKSGSGGSISDMNFSKIVNSGDFSLNLKSGKININTKKNSNNQNRGTATAGSVGSVNIDYLSNMVPGMEIVLNLNEDDPNNLNSSNCACLEGTQCSTVSDPTIGNIKINYINSGSYLPKKLDIIKRVPISSSPTIIIKSCYLLSSGNSQLFYRADNLNLEASNLADIARDFNSSSKIGFYIFNQVFCPVCDSLELDNPLRIDKEYTIYSSGDSNIVDLNIYYLTPDGNIFRPPGYPSDQNYIVYSLKSGQKIEATNGLLFNGVKEYHINKEKLLFNPRMLDLETIESETKLFCPGQKYRLVYKLQNNQTKTIDFTPIFNIR